jgi:hypothetical protein
MAKLLPRFKKKRINFHKSELIPINIESKELLSFIEIFWCKEGAFPVKYLGIPLHFDKLKREDLQPLIESTLRNYWLKREVALHWSKRVLT